MQQTRFKKTNCYQLLTATNYSLLPTTNCHMNIYTKQLYEAEKVLHVEITFKHKATIYSIAVSHLSPARF